MNITHFFDKTFCINLDSRPDRWRECTYEFEKNNIKNVERFAAVDGKSLIDIDNISITPPRLALVLSNIKILEESIIKNYRSILILEDDIQFTEEINNIESYFKYLPDDWDMLYFGGNHNTHMGVTPPEIINDKVCKLHYTFSTHCVAINRKSFNRILERISKKNDPLDVMYVDLQKELKVYSFYPAIATQRIGFSDIENMVTDYRWLIK